MGLYMLYQGAEAFTLWTGKQMPVELVKERYFDEPEARPWPQRSNARWQNRKNYGK